MEPIELNVDKFKKDRKLIIPNLKNFNSLYFHPLTKDYESSNYTTWGLQLFHFCKKGNIQYYFFKKGGRKINVYPNSVIEEWFEANKQKIKNAKKKTSSLTEEQRIEILEMIKRLK